jgi:hypothetical protein
MNILPHGTPLRVTAAILNAEGFMTSAALPVSHARPNGDDFDLMYCVTLTCAKLHRALRSQTFRHEEHCRMRYRIQDTSAPAFRVHSKPSLIRINWGRRKFENK